MQDPTAQPLAQASLAPVQGIPILPGKLHNIPRRYRPESEVQLKDLRSTLIFSKMFASAFSHKDPLYARVKCRKQYVLFSRG